MNRYSRRTVSKKISDKIRECRGYLLMMVDSKGFVSHVEDVGGLNADGGAGHSAMLKMAHDAAGVCVWVNQSVAKERAVIEQSERAEALKVSRSAELSGE